MKKSAIIESAATIIEAAGTFKAPGSYSTEFSDFSRHREGQPAWLTALNREGYAQFTETGFPTTHDEDWRFTNVAPISQTRFALADGAVLEDQLRVEDLERFASDSFACRLVFINGRYSEKHSRIPALPKGVKAGSLAAEIAAAPDGVQPHLGRYLNFYRDAFAALNTAFTADGAYVYVPRGTVLEVPVYVLCVSAPTTSPVMTHPRNLIVVGENSQATIVEDYVSLSAEAGTAEGGSATGERRPAGEHAALSNSATELVVGDSAVVSHYMIVRESERTFNVSTLRIQQARSSNVATHSLLLGGALIRNNVHPVLAGEGAECLINGLFMGNGRQHMDNYMLVEHLSSHCNSRQFYNGILNGQSHGVFHGRIIVHKDAQKTDAKQTNRNLLLSDDAQIDTKPQLEIYADDVKCTHGATIGQVDENALFYLRSRGLDEAAARRLLLGAFASECLDRMHEGPVREHVERLVAEWLPETARFEAERTTPVERTFEEVG